MRNPKRIPHILGLVKQVWEKWPDQRLCQLIHNAVSLQDNKWHGKDQFYVEDDILERGLQKTIDYIEEHKDERAK